jgi:hypothetical protein
MILQLSGINLEKPNMELSSAAASPCTTPTIRTELARTKRNLRRLLQRFVKRIQFNNNNAVFYRSNQLTVDQTSIVLRSLGDVNYDQTHVLISPGWTFYSLPMNYME